MKSNRQSLFLYSCIVWFLGAGFFFSEYVLRVSPAIMFPELMNKFSVGAAAMGAISSFFYYPYIVMQIPVGILTDRYGPRKIMVLAALLTGLACILFGVANNVETAMFARLVMGFCAAFAFVGTLRIAINWFDIKYFPLLVGLTQAAGMLGAAFGGGPLSAYVLSVGVQVSMFSFAILFIIISFFMCIMLYKSPINGSKIKDESVAVLFGVAKSLKNKQFLVNCFYIGCLYAPTTVIGESWGVNFTESFRLLSQTDAAFLVGLIFIGLAVGCPIMGIISTRFGNVFCMRVSAFGCLLCSVTIIYIPFNYIPFLIMIYFLYGIFNAGLIPSYARSAVLVDKSISGVALGITNMFSVLIGAISVQIVGFLLDLYSTGAGYINGVYPQSSYHIIFIILIIFFILAFMLSLCMRDRDTSKV